MQSDGRRDLELHRKPLSLELRRTKLADDRTDAEPGRVDRTRPRGPVGHVTQSGWRPLSNGEGGISRYGLHRIGGTDCRADGPFGSYRWSISRNQLTLTAIHERCGNRRAIWQSTWTRTN
jgi:hypothetical protein